MTLETFTDKWPSTSLVGYCKCGHHAHSHAVRVHDRFDHRYDGRCKVEGCKCWWYKSAVGEE